MTVGSDRPDHRRTFHRVGRDNEGCTATKPGVQTPALTKKIAKTCNSTHDHRRAFHQAILDGKRYTSTKQDVCLPCLRRLPVFLVSSYQALVPGKTNPCVFFSNFSIILCLCKSCDGTTSRGVCDPHARITVSHMAPRSEPCNR